MGWRGGRGGGRGRVGWGASGPAQSVRRNYTSVEGINVTVLERIYEFYQVYPVSRITGE